MSIGRRFFSTSTAASPAATAIPLLVAYLVTWVAEQLGTLHLWNPPFYHPAPNVLAYTDHMIGLGLLAWPAVKAGISPIVLINGIGFLAFLSTAIALFFWLLDDRDPVASRPSPPQ